MHDKAFLMLLRVNLPDFLETNPVMLRVGLFAEIEFLHQLLTETAAAALGENRIPGAQLVTGFIGRLLAAVLGNTHVTRYHSGYAAVFGMLRLKKGNFSFMSKVEAGEMTMAGTTVTGLLMEFSRQSDEGEL